MDKPFKYTYAFTSLTQARELQSRISQIDLEIKLKKLNRQSSFNEISDSADLDYLERFRTTLTEERDALISTAISYAAEILLDDIEHKVSGHLSLGAMLIDSLWYFVSVFNIKVHLSTLARIKLIELSIKLILPELQYMDVSSKVDKLKKQLF